MAGRNYNIPMKDAPLPSDKKSKKSLLEMLMYDDLEEDLEDAERQTGLFSSLQLCLCIILSVAFVTSALVYFVAAVRYDYGNGASTGSELVEEIAGYMNSPDYDVIKRYLPRTLREEGFIPDSEAFAEFRSTYGAYHIGDYAVLSDDAFLDTAQLEQGLTDVYGKTESIREARMVTLRFCLSDGSKKEPVAATVSLIPIRILHKWYIYTGSPVSYEGETSEFLTIQAEALDTDGQEAADISYVEKQEIPVTEADAVPLDFYEGAAEDLLSGKFVLNSTEHVMPDLLSAFSGVFALEEDALPASQSRTLAQDEILGNLPVTFAEDMPEDMKLYVSVANLSKEPVHIRDANVTTLCISGGMGEPVLFLPGNVTFGTSFLDVANMYGDLKKSTEDEQFKGQVSDAVYYVDLKNRRNRIYLGFRDGRLAEVEWFYIDMTDYREL